MSFAKKRFEHQLPSFFQSVLRTIDSFGLTLTLVGGSIRDFAREEKLGKDWDIELSSETLAFNKDLWKEIGKGLAKLGRVSYLPYEIIRLELQGYQFEFSPPRKETFIEGDGGHKNFIAEFDFRMPYEEAVKRRDFTINTMGMRFKKNGDFEFLDPLEGLRHLRENVLHPAGPDFSKDPVRFLRALRFARKYKMELSPQLKIALQEMPVVGFTPAYLWSEMQKSGDPLGFYLLLFKWSSYHPDLSLPVGKEIIAKAEDLYQVMEAPEQHENWIVALEWVGINANAWQQYFGVSGESYQRLARWAKSSRDFQKILPETFHGDFEEVLKNPQFQILFDWYFSTKQIQQKHPKLPVTKMIEDYLPDWVHLFKFGPLKDVKHIDPPLRAKYQVWNLVQRL